MSNRRNVSRILTAVVAIALALAVVGCGRVGHSEEQPHVNTPQAPSLETSTTE